MRSAGISCHYLAARARWWVFHVPLTANLLSTPISSATAATLFGTSILRFLLLTLQGSRINSRKKTTGTFSKAPTALGPNSSIFLAKEPQAIAKWAKHAPTSSLRMSANFVLRHPPRAGSHVGLLCIKCGQCLLLFALGHLEVIKGEAKLRRHLIEHLGWYV